MMRFIGCGIVFASVLSAEAGGVRGSEGRTIAVEDVQVTGWLQELLILYPQPGMIPVDK